VQCIHHTDVAQALRQACAAREGGPYRYAESQLLLRVVVWAISAALSCCIRRFVYRFEQPPQVSLSSANL
jgi:hypothetical protein